MITSSGVPKRSFFRRRRPVEQPQVELLTEQSDEEEWFDWETDDTDG